MHAFSFTNLLPITGLGPDYLDQLPGLNPITQLPGPITNLSKCETSNGTTEICLEWTKPSGGDAIIDFVLQLNSDGNVTEYSGIRTYNHTIKGLQPSSDVNVSIWARNSAGSGKKVLANFTTREY